MNEYVMFASCRQGLPSETFAIPSAVYIKEDGIALEGEAVCTLGDRSSAQDVGRGGGGGGGIQVPLENIFNGCVCGMCLLAYALWPIISALCWWRGGCGQLAVDSSWGGYRRCWWCVGGRDVVRWRQR